MCLPNVHTFHVYIECIFEKKTCNEILAPAGTLYVGTYLQWKICDTIFLLEHPSFAHPSARKANMFRLKILYLHLKQFQRNRKTPL